MSDRTTPIKAGVAMLALLGALAALLFTFGAGSAGAQALTLTAPGTLGGETGNRFCVNFDVSGASSSENLAFAVTSGALPSGLSLDSHTFGAVAPNIETRAGIGGTPTGVGTSTFEITVTDDQGTAPVGDDVTASDDYTIDVIAAVDADITIAAGRIGSGPYTIDCDSQGREVQGFVRDLGNFGTGGSVAERVAIRNHNALINATYLAGVDVLLDGWVFDSDWAPAELTAIETWVEAGGVLIANEDSNAADALGALFGAPTTSQTLCNHTPSETGDPTQTCPEFSAASTTHPVVTGPFGDWTAAGLATSGSVGQYDPDPAGWQVIARNPAGRATIITRRVESGRVIVTTDEGLFRTESYGSSAGNATFVGNLLAYAIDPFGSPELIDDELNGRVGVELSVDLCANDASLGDTPVSVEVVGDELPDGLALTDCTVEGTPTDEGDATVTYQVTDADGDSGTADVTISIGEAYTCAGETATIIGTPGTETLVGTSGDDVIVSLGGADTVRGRGGDDVICGGRGDDIIEGQAGDDMLFGQRGNDTVKGLNGTDEVIGNGGDDTLAGNAGPADRCIGGLGENTILAGCEISRP